MTRVNYFSLSDDGTDWYRGRGVFHFINHPDISFSDISYLNPGSWSSICNCEVLIIQRPFDQTHEWIITQAKIMGKRVICDFDDNVLRLPIYHPVYEAYEKNQESIKKCLRACDEIWVSTPSLKQEFITYNQNIHVIPNAHNDYLHPVGKKLANNPNHQTVFYRGGTTHKIDLLQYSKQICDVAITYKDWHIYMLGVIDNWEFQHAASKANNISVANKIPLIQYFQHIYDLNSALAICPLMDNPINRSKSNISWIEATYCGSAFIGKKTLPEFNHDFIFDIDHLDKFGEYCNPARMKRFNEQSWAYIHENLLLSKVNQLRIERILS